MADGQSSLNELVREFSRNVQVLEERIASVPPAERARLEHGLTTALASVASLNPLGENSKSLVEPASAYGVYSRDRINQAALHRLNEPQGRAALDAALDGTGISSDELIARLRIGADSAALESHWHASDVRAVGARLGLVAAQQDAERTLDRLENAYSRVETTLQDVGVLREALDVAEVRGTTEEVTARAVTHPAQRADERAAPLADEGTGRFGPIRARLKAALDRVGERAAGSTGTSDADGRRREQEADARLLEVAAVRMSGEPRGDYVFLNGEVVDGRVLFRPYGDEFVELGSDYDEMKHEEHKAELRLIGSVAARGRDAAPTTDAFADTIEAEAFRTALERQLDADERLRLRRGEESALAQVAEDRIDRLILTKAYLESNPATRGSAVHTMVLKQIVHEQVDLQALRDGHEEEGPSHG